VWTDLRWSEQSSGPVFRDSATHAPSPTGGAGTDMLYRVDCGGSGSFRWAAQEAYIDPQVVIDAAYASAQAQIPTPAIDISPSPAVGGIVNVGMWLAVGDPGQVNAFASVGPVWASITARFTGTTWDMGNGDVVTCDGLGTPYAPGSNTLDAGPCGYTYEQASLGVAPYHVVVSGHWDVSLATSSGRAEALTPIDMSLEFDYDVDEIQTVGEG
jgi:hypothetical protein